MMANADPDDEDVDQFEVVKYPAIATSDEYLSPSGEIVFEDEPGAHLLRRQGEALHPARYDLKKLSKIRRLNQKGDGTDGRWWSALYQQNPVPDDGAYFKKEQFRRAGLPPLKQCNVFIAWDFAISEKKQNDYCVGSVLLQDPNDVLHVAEVLRFKSGDSFFIVESILDLAQRWASPTLQLGFEDGQIYRAMQTILSKRMSERRQYPPVQLLRPITDKMARAKTLQGRMEQGKVSFNLQGDWYEVARAEMLRFPAGVHDDIVDSLAWGALMAVGRQPPRLPKPKEMRSWKDKLKVGYGTVGHMAA
jgi:predicted phage terminase large subunit-like protein